MQPRIGFVGPRQANIIRLFHYQPHFPAVTFDVFFKTATGNAPYAYQRRLAGDTAGAPCKSQLINIPTGLGKTAAVVLAWLWNRVLHPDASHRETWPRRLVYCLPMRTLVEQTHEGASKWLNSHQLLWDGESDHAGKVGLHLLMGGSDPGAWDIFPEADAILIGTQDMLLSRALNRGYGMKRARWPMQFGLLNNDCLWIMDETQLMGPGLGTSAQLEAFRLGKSPGFSTYGGANSVTWYASATNSPKLLLSRDWRKNPRPPEFEFCLTDEEKSATHGEIFRRRSAMKALNLRKEDSFSNPASAEKLVDEIVERHEAMVQALKGTPTVPIRTLIICNTVDRAKEVYTRIAQSVPKTCDFLLLHSRFRPPERRAQMERLNSPNRATFPDGQIVVSTQVIEAGVDVSSGILWSEVAPLASLVQRLGRLNRGGEFNGLAWKPQASIIGLGLDAGGKKESKEAKEKREKENAKLCLPYDLASCDPQAEASAWKPLDKLRTGASPASLESIQHDIAASISCCPYSLQRHELLDFFDTDANLSMGFTDVSPFVRGLDEDTDLQVLWRESWIQADGTEGINEPGFTPDYERDELCQVPIGKAHKARVVLNKGWLWRGRESGWISVSEAGLAPGMTILLPIEAGGYDMETGWTGEQNDNSHSSYYQPREWPSDEDQLSSRASGWQSIAVHTRAVSRELHKLLDNLFSEAPAERNALELAVHWHDIGKNHPGWQQAVVSALEKARITGKDTHRPFAKFSLSDSPALRNDDGSAKLTGKHLHKKLKELSRYFRPTVTHEVASALAFRQAEQRRLGSGRDTDLGSLLAEYLIMSHHGHVRKVLRDEIPRFPSDSKDAETVRGIKQGSSIPPVEIDGQTLGCESLSTDCRKMGRSPDGHESYTRGVLRLLEHYGPFRLAFFEAVFRAADIRASILAKSMENATLTPDERHRDNPPVEGIAAGAQAATSMGSHSPERGPEHGIRAGTGFVGDDSRDTRPERATRHVETQRGILSYSELAPLLAERVIRLEEAIQREEFHTRVLDEALVCEFHHRICGDLTPEWAGKWRAIEVTVGSLTPPAPNQLPMLMRDYGLDLQARWEAASGDDLELIFEFLAFAEGRFLSIHPFRDFNGRTIRVFLAELLRRLDLPLVNLAPESETGRSRYFAALEAADRRDWQPLIAIWKARFTS
ncbi:MAG: Fic family protein [Opitutaceae bacterium]|nr:Fic family protein [Opitutaceae bacterium]